MDVEPHVEDLPLRNAIHEKPPGGVPCVDGGHSLGSPKHKLRCGSVTAGDDEYFVE